MNSIYRGPAVYVFRTRRPGLIGMFPAWLAPVACALSFWALFLLGYPLWPALLALLFSSRHFAYVGETTAVRLRRSQHTEGGGNFDAQAKPWADLDPTFYYLRMPRWKWLLHSVETLLIGLLWPVYNHQKNLWNPRRIPLQSARVQRAMRDQWSWSLNCRPVHALMSVGAALLTFYSNGWLS